MKKKLRRILLIDDDYNCNFFHKRLLNKMDCVEQIHVATDGAEALDFLKSGEHPKPEVIFLDINMPRMNGWEFLEEYNKLDQALRAKIVLVMLTTSLNPDDRQKALSSGFVNGFQNKYLDKESLTKVLSENFKELF